LGADEKVATLFLAVFSVGIGAGSLACNSLLKGEISGRYVPWAALGMSAASVGLYFASLRDTAPETSQLISNSGFFAVPLNVAVLACLLGISFFGGLYIVPLYAIIQSRSDEDKLAGVTACTNVMDSLFMVISSVITTVMLEAGFSIPQIFLVMAALTVIASFVIRSAVHEQMSSSGTL
jgi:acyl-[acyl-carrier-protein]-phospholipid O-acyltransferase/long-chain-fatty-acid--[acyl-carrier-protein] ligase